MTTSGSKCCASRTREEERAGGGRRWPGQTSGGVHSGAVRSARIVIACDRAARSRGRWKARRAMGEAVGCARAAATATTVNVGAAVAMGTAPPLTRPPTPPLSSSKWRGSNVLAVTARMACLPTHAPLQCVSPPPPPPAPPLPAPPPLPRALVSQSDDRG